MERNRIITVTSLLIALCFCQIHVSGQTLLFENQPEKLRNHPNFGPNRLNFFHAFLSSTLCFPFPGDQSIETRQPFSGQVKFGFRYKYKTSAVISIVSELGLNRSYYRITQVTGKSFPDSISHQSQSIRLNGLFGGLFIRIRLGQRGDYLGNCIDLGIMAQTQILNQLITRDLTNSTHPSTFNVEKTTISKLADINPVNYKAAIRLGLDRVSLIASYQLSRLLSRSAGKDLPGLEIGIEISPVRY